ncbi:hypothetical protein P5F16_03380 [Clostridium perfringens]|nr:hypothetical protein [Clostridium perfringens]
MSKFLKDDYNVIFIEDVKEEYIRNHIKFTKEKGKNSYVINENNLDINLPKKEDFGQPILL